MNKLATMHNLSVLDTRSLRPEGAGLEMTGNLRYRGAGVEDRKRNRVFLLCVLNNDEAIMEQLMENDEAW